MPYFDHAATTPIDPGVAEEMMAELREPANASSVHRDGQRARARLEDARERLAALLGVATRHVVFTSGATEANNLAIRGLAKSLGKRLGRAPRVLSSVLEHACVRETVAALARDGEVEYVPMEVMPDGRAAVPDVRAELLCLMAAQNETGVLQDMAAARAWKQRTGGLWLCDVTQTLGRLGVNAPQMGADFFSMSSHKINGPPGVGALVGPGIDHLLPMMTGGPQEHGLRAGTQPVAAISVFVLAAEILALPGKKAEFLNSLTAEVVAVLRASGARFQINNTADSVPGFLNISLDGLTGADVVIALDTRGFSVSSGSACSTGVMEISPALAAQFPKDEPRARGAVRISAGHGNTIEEARALGEAMAKLAGK